MPSKKPKKPPTPPATLPNYPLTAPTEPARSGRLSPWFFFGLIASVAGVVVATDRLAPHTQIRDIVVDVPAYVTFEKTQIVETVDGKKVEVRLPTQEMVMKKEVISEEMRSQPTAEQRVKLQIVIGVSVVVGAFTVGVFAIYLRLQLLGKRVPRAIEDWVKYLVSGMVGALLGFVGSPTGAPATTTHPVPAVASPNIENR